MAVWFFAPILSGVPDAVDFDLCRAQSLFDPFGLVWVNAQADAHSELNWRGTGTSLQGIWSRSSSFSARKAWLLVKKST